jgi:hypothetical protein
MIYVILVVVVIISLAVMFIFFHRKEKYQVMDIAKDVCRIGCLSRGYPQTYCFDYFGPFMKNCIGDMIKTSGPIPKDIHLEDIYNEYHAYL